MSPERFEKLVGVANKRQPDLTVVLENVFDPHNISAVLRTCDSVGVQEIFVLNTRIPRHEKFGRRSSSSSAKWMTVHQFEDLDACIKELRSRYQYIYATHLSPQSGDMFQMDLTQSMALVFGNEHSGCCSEIIAAADGSFAIPQMGIIQSLNISVACAVTLYEALRQRRYAGMYDSSRMEKDKQKSLLRSWAVYEELYKQSEGK